MYLFVDLVFCVFLHLECFCDFICDFLHLKCFCFRGLHSLVAFDFALSCLSIVLPFADLSFAVLL